MRLLDIGDGFQWQDATVVWGEEVVTSVAEAVSGPVQARSIQLARTAVGMGNVPVVTEAAQRNEAIIASPDLRPERLLAPPKRGLRGGSHFGQKDSWPYCDFSCNPYAVSMRVAHVKGWCDYPWMS